MTNFFLHASICEPGLYLQFANDEINLTYIVTSAFERGVTDFCEEPIECRLNGFVGLAGSWIITYDKEEDMFDIWSQINE